MTLPSLLDLIDILLVAGFGWFAIRALQRTRARSAVVGLGVVIGVYLAASGLGLRLTVTLLQGFFAVVVLVLVVVFQEDLRRFFDGLGAWRPGREPPRADAETTDLLARVVTRLAAQRTGALIVLPGREPLERHVQGGVRLDGALSEPLLLSLFDASSPGHDGAVLIRDGRVERFAVHLPLSAHHERIGGAGTRHAAALGLSERSDAVVLVVSEERGTVSIAQQGTLEVLARPEDVVATIRDTLTPPAPDESTRRQRLREAALAFAGALALWMLLVPGADHREATLEVPVAIANLPADLRLEAVDPATVEITVRGPRRDLFLTDASDVKVEIDGYLARLGRRTFTIEAGDVRTPGALEVLSIVPDTVKLSVSETGTETKEDRPTPEARR